MTYINDGSLMGIDTAVEVAANQIRNSRGAGFAKVNLGFGDIMIMGHNAYDSLDPIGEIMKWNKAPVENRMVRYHIREDNWKWFIYVPFKIGMSLATLKWVISMTLCKLVLMEVSQLDEYSVYDNYVYGLNTVYQAQYDTQLRSVEGAAEKYAAEFILGGKLFRDSTKEFLVEERFRQKVKAGEKLVEELIDDRHMLINKGEILKGKFLNVLLRMATKLARATAFSPEYATYLADAMSKDGSVNCYPFIRELVDANSTYLSQYKEYIKNTKERIEQVVAERKAIKEEIKANNEKEIKPRKAKHLDRNLALPATTQFREV